MATAEIPDLANGNGDANSKTDAPSPSAAGEKRDIDLDSSNASPDAKRVKKSDDGMRQTTLDGNLEIQEQNAAHDEKESQKEIPPEENNEIHRTERGENETAELPHEDKKVPSNVLEKGIIYFFFRARVNVDHPEEVNGIARSYLILRPLSLDSKLGDGPIGDAGNSRLLALPKKVLPESGRDRFMVFVEKSSASFADLREQFLEGGENQNKSGTSRVPDATPAGEGVYVITTTGRESHLAYMLTLPSELGEVQNELGLKEQGSFILSTKNPKFPGPANARLPEAPDFTQKIKDDFGNLRWMPSQPEHLDYVNAQILMIGESSGIEKAMEPRKKDVKEGKDEPKEVLEEIEDQDTRRMAHLAGDESTAIFADLQARAKDYPKLQTTF